MQQEVAKLGPTAIDFPPTQAGASFNLEAAKAQIAKAQASHVGDGSRPLPASPNATSPRALGSRVRRLHLERPLAMRRLDQARPMRLQEVQTGTVLAEPA
ncbi:hypothetical protein C3941_00020 [Kaistia algarum]|uniref:hypothetical protein n=1 Tax=Kaistia algarum TaxID=2083279 RepID=UPI000CE7BF63|nr:hypothetical protein [Kaistia algarum]MCX5513397.1 hypothetical protein [Kaistia algarum]PPE81158.1 hypothetical protein C3941_00020 [Kaistia algarum]